MKGKVWKFGDNVNTDEIIPARYLNTSDAKELAAHVMEDADPDFVKKMKPGDIIVAGENFGCGSSREHAPIAIKAAGISCVVAKSFARIFFRNAINIGLPIIAAGDAAEETSQGDVLDVDLAGGKITNTGTGKVYSFPRFPRELEGIIKEGGLINYVKKNVTM
jgi:3-isopropylmalate/(R)-2-methylmalate dehydratase small subunit